MTILTDLGFLQRFTNACSNCGVVKPIDDWAGTTVPAGRWTVTAWPKGWRLCVRIKPFTLEIERIDACSEACAAELEDKGL